MNSRGGLETTRRRWHRRPARQREPDGSRLDWAAGHLFRQTGFVTNGDSPTIAQRAISGVMVGCRFGRRGSRRRTERSFCVSSCSCWPPPGLRAGARGWKPRCGCGH